MTQKQNYKNSAQGNNSNCAERDFLLAKCVVNRILEQKIDLTFEYNDWLYCGFSLASLGEAGRELFQKVSSMYPNYNPKECDKKFTNCLKSSKNGISLATFFEMAKNAGVDITLPEELKPRRGRPAKSEDEKRKEKSNAAILAMELLDKNAAFRYNVITDCVEIRMKDKNGNCVGEWKRFEDRDFNTLYSRVKTNGISINKGDLEALIWSMDFSTDYNPFAEYVDSLDEWDQNTDYIEQFFNYFVFESDDVREFCMPLLKKWFVSMVALWLGVIDDNQLMIVLVGPPSIGKTYFCKILLPSVLKDYFHIIYPQDKIDKDQFIAMSDSGLVVFDEFEVDSKSVNTMKAIITSSGSDYRGAYARNRKQRKRKASFIGSCNEMQYLASNNNDRRYVSVSVVSSIHTSIQPLPYDGAYAQAKWIIEHESKDYYRPDKNDAHNIQQHNLAFTKPDVCMELLSSKYRAPTLRESGVYVDMADIKHEFSWYRDPQFNSTNIGKAMKKLGIETKRSAAGNRYYVFEISDADRESQYKKEGKDEYDRLLKEAEAENTVTNSETQA